MSHWLDNHYTLSHIPHYDVEGVSSKQLADYLAKSGAKAGKASEGSYRLPKSSQHTETPPQTYLDFLKAGGKPHEYRG